MYRYLPDLTEMGNAQVKMIQLTNKFGAVQAHHVLVHPSRCDVVL